MTAGAMDMEKFVGDLQEYIARALSPLAERIKALERKAAEVEERGIRYRGVWQASDHYKRGDLVTYDGSLWHCCAAASSTTPGTTHDWQLAVKRGGK